MSLSSLDKMASSTPFGVLGGLGKKTRRGVLGGRGAWGLVSGDGSDFPDDSFISGVGTRIFRRGEVLPFPLSSVSHSKSLLLLPMSGIGLLLQLDLNVFVETVSALGQ